MQRVLLDTQIIYIAAIDGLAALPPKVQALLQNDQTVRILSVASIMEVALKSNTGKQSGMQMGEAEMRQAIRDLRLDVIAFEERHAYRLFTLPLHHRDPFDRMIIATALAEDIPLIGADREFKKYKGLKVIW